MFDQRYFQYATRDKITMEQVTFCPQCGFNVPTDEDGCCTKCGATAVGDAVDELCRDFTVTELFNLQQMVHSLYDKKLMRADIACVWDAIKELKEITRS